MRRLVFATLVGVLTALLAVPVAAAPPEISTEIVDESSALEVKLVVGFETEAGDRELVSV